MLGQFKLVQDLGLNSLHFESCLEAFRSMDSLCVHSQLMQGSPGNSVKPIRKMHFPEEVLSAAPPSTCGLSTTLKGSK